ncbi:protein CHLOROPLAST J-LIKE DOMAIN 1, chloroplastic-like isoform X3 [Phaseolus vulgaris]|uniref:protein CHLOROPLAST J-LIKE DOMAIN 1, chloroplastic-like isoform X3 n=1 Tax=Phaseolus vulgaris TaxID=3885 RepID=UPI0035C9A5CA
MALGISNILHCPKFQPLSVSIFRFTQTTTWSDRKIIYVAASVTGSFNSDGDFNPYEVLGVSHIEKFDMVKATNRKKGVTFGSFKE